jgi:hypothetical protein
MQTNTVLMVRHAAFMSNQETQPSNAFQKRLTGIRDVQIQAQIAFDSYVRALRSVDIDVHIVDDVAEHGTPDSDCHVGRWNALSLSNGGFQSPP